MVDDDALTRIDQEGESTGSMGATPKSTPIHDDRVGRYQLAFEIASGGMATVYLAATHGPAGFEKVFALKRIHPHLAKEKNYVEMFLDEARLAARIQHPNVCGVVDFGEEDGEYYLVMEYLLGVPLSKLLREVARMEQKPPRWPAIAGRLIQDACEGLHAAHELRGNDGSPLGVVHRDVSPQNLFVGFDGVLKVVDFGIAKAADKVSVTRTLELKGKVAYMSPEQIHRGTVDRRTDVFALGVVLWEMLTLRRLFRRSQQVDTMYAVLEGPIPPPSQLRDLPAELDEVILAALDRSPETRTPDAREFGRGLGRVFGRTLDQPVDRGEISQLLHELFPGGEESARALVEIARTESRPRSVVSVVPEAAESFQDVPLATLGAYQEPAAPPVRWGRAAALLTLLIGGAVALAFILPPPEGSPVAEPTNSSESVPAEPADERESSPGVADTTDDSSTAAPSPAVMEPAEEVTAGEVDREATEPATVSPRRRSRRRRPAPTEPVAAVDTPEPAAASAEPTMVEATTGVVNIVVPGGWANVYDASGRLLGATPLRRRLPAGPHTLELRFSGQPPPVAVQVDVPAGDTLRVSRQPP